MLLLPVGDHHVLAFELRELLEHLRRLPVGDEHRMTKFVLDVA